MGSKMNTTQFKNFSNLHNTTTPLILNNIWDAASALIVQNSGANAIATSSASMAWSLGYSDGQSVPIDVMLDSVARIMRVTNIPLSVDIENGFSDLPNEVGNIVLSLKKLGVIGINIEDGNGHSNILTQKIDAIRHLVGSSFFINARTDIFLQNLAEGKEALELTIKRLNEYKAAGANCGFIPGVNDSQLVSEISYRVGMPINIMVNDLDSSILEFKNSEVSRFSVGPNSFLVAYNSLCNNKWVLDYNNMNDSLSI